MNRYENSEILHQSLNDSKMNDEKNNYNGFVLFIFVCSFFGYYSCHVMYSCIKKNYNKYYDSYKKNKNLKEKLILNDDMICSICLENLKDNNCVILNCEHIYHKICIKEWLKKNNSCPNCRINII